MGLCMTILRMYYYFLLVLEVSVFHINNLQIVCNTSYVLYSPNILGILVLDLLQDFKERSLLRLKNDNGVYLRRTRNRNLVGFSPTICESLCKSHIGTDYQGFTFNSVNLSALHSWCILCKIDEATSRLIVINQRIHLNP